jgi:apolipoprotein D and lipocalin family protein
MSTPPPRTAPHVDLDRYLGRWYVIANIPYFLEQGKIASYDTYGKRPDGTLDNTFTFRKGGFDAPEKSWRGTARVTNTATNAEWKVRFLWPFTSTYLVLELDPDYRWAVVGTPGRSLLWILARERHLSPGDYELSSGCSSDRVTIARKSSRCRNRRPEFPTSFCRGAIPGIARPRRPPQ